MRAGSLLESHAIVLSYIPLKESDRLIHLLTLDHGRIAAVAPQAARSVKRFGNALEPMSYIKAHLVVPREQKGEAGIWRLEKADLKSSFLHFRKSYALMESAFFVLRLILDLLPEGHPDPSVFKALGRFLKQSDLPGIEKIPAFLRASFWTWFSQHQGLGSLTEALEKEGVQLGTVWHQKLSESDVNFQEVWDDLLKAKSPDLTINQEIGVYETWLRNSSMHWPYFEDWLRSRRSYSS